MARRAGAAGRQSRDRPQDDQRGADPRLLEAHQQHRSGTASNSTGSRRRRFTIRPRPSSCWPRRAIPSGFDAGEYYCDSSYANLGEAVLDNLQEVGIRAQAAAASSGPRFSKGYGDKKLQEPHPGRQRRLRQRRDPPRRLRRQGRHLRLWQLSRHRRAGSSSRPPSSTTSKRAAILEQDAAAGARASRSYAPIWQLAFINGVGPRVGESGFGLIPGFAYTGALRGHHDQGRIAAPAAAAISLEKRRDISAGVVYVRRKAR